MPSVRDRIRTVTQPPGGFIPKQIVKRRDYDDGLSIDKSSPLYPAYSSVQGLAVDYLTRMALGCTPKKAFEVSLLGSRLVGEAEKADLLLKQIKGIDTESIIFACKLTGYDVAYRRGAGFFRGVDSICPDETVINNIAIMVRRGAQFLASRGPIVDTGFTFDGGYTRLVSSGDGDFLCKKGLWDFKVSQFEPGNSDYLQILLYYLLGVHSCKTKFKDIREIGLFNPMQNVSYEISVSELPDDTLRTVTHDVIGYRVPEDPHLWRATDGEDPDVFNRFIKSHDPQHYLTSFNPESFPDGIHKISKEDYWTYIFDKSKTKRPVLRWTEQVLFLKNDGFLMFVSVSPNGNLCSLKGGCTRKLSRTLNYYYENLPEYGRRVLAVFSKYWDELYRISDFLQSIDPDNTTPLHRESSISLAESSRVSGRVHGCIVDLDFFNHVFLNPYDGTIVPYSADSMYEKHVYSSLPHLLTTQRPDLLPGFESKTTFPDRIAPAQLSTLNQLMKSSDEIENDFEDDYELVYSTEMYSISRRILSLQSIYDHRLVQVWYDGILPDSGLIEGEVKSKREKKREEIQKYNEEMQRRREAGIKTKRIRIGKKPKK